MKKEISIDESLHRELMERVGAEDIGYFISCHIRPYLIYRNFEFKGDLDFSYEEGANQNNDFDRFKYHNWHAYLSLEKIIKDWRPNRKKYEKIEDACHEFLEYYKSRAKQNFPDGHLYRMEDLIDSKLGLNVRNK